MGSSTTSGVVPPGSNVIKANQILTIYSVIVWSFLPIWYGICLPLPFTLSISSSLVIRVWVLAKPLSNIISEVAYFGFVLNIRTQTLWKIYLTAHSFLLIASNGWSSTLIMGACDLRYIVAQCAFTFSRKGIKSTNDGLLAYSTSVHFEALTVVCIITWKTTCRYERSANYLLHAILTITLW